MRISKLTGKNVVVEGIELEPLDMMHLITLVREIGKAAAPFRPAPRKRKR